MSGRRVSLSLVSALALAACTSDVPHPVSPSADPSAARAAGIAAADRYIVAANGAGFAKGFEASIAALGGKVEFLHTGAGIAVVSGVSSASAPKIARLGGVGDVQADASFTIDTPRAAVEADASSVGDVTANSQANPATAILYAWQWNMRLVRANEAWAAGKLGSPSVTVAILDSGIDYDSPDLNGLVDLSRSASFIPSDDAITEKYFPSRHKISDYNGHGTNVATQVSSKAVAFAGVTSRTTLIGVKVLGQSGSGSFSAIFAGVLFAADQGADVANMSLGASFAKAGNGRFLGLFHKVFNYANQQGMVMTVSAGNAGADLDHDGNTFSALCNLSHVICVSSVGPPTATSNPDTPAYYTNFGRSAITVAAPGGNADAANGFAPSVWPWGLDIASWVWSFCSKTLIASFTPEGVPVLTVCAAGNRLSGYIGTSQAAPHVAGEAASIIADQGAGKPSQIKSVIVKSAVDLGQQGTDPFYGRGRIDVAAAFGL